MNRGDHIVKTRERLRPVQNRLHHLLFCILVLLAIGACAPVQPPPSTSVKPIKTTSGVDFQDSTAVRARILNQYNEWQNTPYKMGGLNKRGVDCSGFVYLTFRSKLGCTVPRTTALQVKTGRKIARNNLRAGDLVFFQTGLFSSHVGIYMGDSTFLHASSSRGVILSSLKEKYWKKRFWTARRMCI